MEPINQYLLTVQNWPETKLVNSKGQNQAVHHHPVPSSLLMWKLKVIAGYWCYSSY